MVKAKGLSLRGPEGAVAISGRQLRFRRWLSHDTVEYCEIAPQGHFLALRAQGATSACGLLAMTSLGALHIRRKYLQICSCQRRSLTAATDAIGAYRFHGGLYKSAVPSRDCHVGLWPPRNDKSGTVCILSLPNTNRQLCTGRGMPLPYSALREAMGKTPLSTLNSRCPAGGYPRTGISSNPGRAPIPRRGSDCSRPDCAPRPPRASARRPAAGSARPTERNTSRFP